MILALLPYFVDLLLAQLEGLLLFMVRALEHMELRLVLLLERTQILVADDFIKEGLELSLDLFKGIWVET